MYASNSHLDLCTIRKFHCKTMKNAKKGTKAIYFFSNYGFRSCKKLTQGLYYIFSVDQF